MEWLKAGFGELSRKSDRLRKRLALRHAKKQLAKAEAELGLLGWQQVDFFDAETQVEVARIHYYEREQVRLANRSAELADQLDELQAKREAGKKEFDEALARIEVDRQPLTETVAANEAKLRVRGQAITRFHKAAAGLDTLEATLSRRRAELQAGEQSDAIRAELRQIEERRGRIPDEKRQLLSEEDRIRQEILELEEVQRGLRPRLDQRDAQVQELSGNFEAADRELAGQIAEAEREKTSTSEEADALDAEKGEPYQRIGACLADHGIAPMNQPEALGKVLELRGEIGDLKKQITHSLRESQSVERKSLHTFYSVVLAAGITLLVAMLTAGALWLG